MYKNIKIEDLIFFEARDIRENTIIKLEERIKNTGYNNSKPLTVVKSDKKYIVADGNHRLKVLKDLNFKEVPCYITNDNIYSLVMKNNLDEDTYSKMDLFDYLDIIKKMKNDNYSRKDISKYLNWTTDKLSKHLNLLSKMSDGFLEKMKKIERADVPLNGTHVRFSEYWFRESGIYELNNKYQEYFINEILNENVSINNKNQIQRLSAKLHTWQELILIAREKLVNENDFTDIVKLIENNNFKNEGQLLSKINDLNNKAANKLICGDSIIELEKLDDCSIDLVITDPPYGIDYSSNRSQDNNHVTKNKILNDKKEAFNLLDKTCEILNRKTKADSHFYFFTSWKVYSKFEEIISKYFSIKNMIIWDKCNHGSGDLNNSWGNRHELIIFATKGNRSLNMRKPDIINISKVASNKMIHPTQKPLELITEILKVSSQKADTIIDPFMGSGAIIKAIKEYENLNYIGIELDKKYFEIARSFINE